MKNIGGLFENLDKVFRYLVPAFVFIILLRHFYQSIYNQYVSTLSKSEFIFYFVLLGVTIYSIHRVVFEVFDYIIIKIIKKKSVTEVILSSLKLDEKTRDYFYYKCANIHSALITTELILVFILISSDHYGKIFGLLFIIAFIVYIGYLNIQMKIYNSLDDKKISKS